MIAYDSPANATPDPNDPQGGNATMDTGIPVSSAAVLKALFFLHTHPFILLFVLWWGGDEAGDESPDGGQNVTSGSPSSPTQPALLRQRLARGQNRYRLANKPQDFQVSVHVHTWSTAAAAAAQTFSLNHIRQFFREHVSVELTQSSSSSFMVTTRLCSELLCRLQFLCICSHSFCSSCSFFSFFLFRFVFGSSRPVSWLETTSNPWWRSMCVDRPTGPGSRGGTTLSLMRYSKHAKVAQEFSHAAAQLFSLLKFFFCPDVFLQCQHAALRSVWKAHQLQGEYRRRVWDHLMLLCPSELLAVFILLQVYNSYSLRADCLMGEFKVWAWHWFCVCLFDLK